MSYRMTVFGLELFGLVLQDLEGYKCKENGYYHVWTGHMTLYCLQLYSEKHYHNNDQRVIKNSTVDYKIFGNIMLG